MDITRAKEIHLFRAKAIQMGPNANNPVGATPGIVIKIISYDSSGEADDDRSTF